MYLRCLFMRWRRYFGTLFGYEWQEEFEWIDETPLGSASIAQVHRARLKTGEEVVIKVQRKGIYETMARDIGLMHKLVSLVPPISITDMVDFKMVLNELWKVTQEEMNFIIEAGKYGRVQREEQGRCICGYAGSFLKNTPRLRLL